MENQQISSGSNESNDGQKDNNNKKPNDQKNDRTCTICWDEIRSRALTDTCLHQFCFECIRRWSQRHSLCPFCRRVFYNVLFNIRSETSFDQMVVGLQALNPDNPNENIDNGNDRQVMIQQVVQLRNLSVQSIGELNIRLTQLDPNSIEFIETLQLIADAEQRIEQYNEVINLLRQQQRRRNVVHRAIQLHQNNKKQNILAEVAEVAIEERVELEGVPPKQELEPKNNGQKENRISNPNNGKNQNNDNEKAQGIGTSFRENANEAKSSIREPIFKQFLNQNQNPKNQIIFPIAPIRVLLQSNINANNSKNQNLNQYKNNSENANNQNNQNQENNNQNDNSQSGSNSGSLNQKQQKEE